MLLIFISSLYSSTDVSFYPKTNGILSLLAVDVLPRISSQSLLVSAGIGQDSIGVSVFAGLVLIVVHDTIFVHQISLSLSLNNRWNQVCLDCTVKLSSHPTE